MDLKKLEATINEIKINKGESLVEIINVDQTLRADLNLDSFDLAELTVVIEDEYGVDIFEDGICNTVGEVLNKLIS